MTHFEPSQQNHLLREPGYLLSAVLIGILVALLCSVEIVGIDSGKDLKTDPGTILLGLYIMAWGCMFLASYYYSHKSFFLYALILLCEQFSHPNGRKMAFFYFALALFLGFLAILKGMGLIV